MERNELVIRFEQVRKTFRKTTVLRGIDLTLNRGDRVALVGSNGAGKTTLVRCLLGQYGCDGKVRVNDLDPRQARTEVLQKVGFVPQLPPPLKITVEQLVQLSADLCGSDPQKMYDVAESLGLRTQEVRNRVFMRLSGGEKQKLLIGIALGRDTDLLVLDEPAANLDPEARQVFFNLLSERLASTTMIISSHRLDEVAPLVNRVVELDTGRVVLDDQVDEGGSLSARLSCVIRLTAPSEAFGKAIANWGFKEQDGAWQGTIAGPDRLRFLGVMSRYSGLLADIEIKENRHA
jgi:ABC-2 type transport system ATP-binding protein